MSIASSEENTMAVIRQKDIPARHLHLNELALRCQDDILQFQQHGQSNSCSPYGMELFRRAILLHDEAAWSCIYELFQGVVGSWIKMYAGTDGIVTCNYEEVARLVNTAFARFSCAFSAQHLERCASVFAILRYLKLCTRSAVFDEMRDLLARAEETSLEALMEAGEQSVGERSKRYNEIEEQIIGRVWAQELWRAIQEDLYCEDDARALLTLLYEQDMKPAQIWHQYPWWFATLNDVIAMQRRIRTRLLKNPRIRSHLAADREVDTPSARPVAAPSPDPVPSAARAPIRGASPSFTPSIPAPARPEPEALADLAVEEQSIPLAAHEPVVIAAPAPVVRPETRAKPTPAIHYRLQRSFCGKANCKKCRDGRGHGPYWYAYRYEHGQTKTTYLGKAALNQNEKEHASAREKHTAPRTVQQKPTPAERTYHLQRTFCGKARCKKCRDGGEGHGPYWFAYELVNGKTVRRYVGKALPAGVTAEGSVARTWANTAESGGAHAPIR